MSAPVVENVVVAAAAGAAAPVVENMEAAAVAGGAEGGDSDLESVPVVENVEVAAAARGGRGGVVGVASCWCPDLNAEATTGGWRA